ncbi:MAG: nicotinamide mononucleotide transporter [Clostridia bacterium]|nr:nicotinamide mononucleotide transporter [Clostridia bacterium]
MDNLIKSFKSLKWYEWIMIIVMVAIAGWKVVESVLNLTPTADPNWLAIVNFISGICGIICIFFCAKASVSNYVFGLVNTIVYVLFLIHDRIYGTLALELLVYLPLNIFGWIVWARNRDKQDTEKTLSRKLTWWQDILSVIAVGFTGVICYFGLSKLGGAVPWLDAYIVAVGVIASMLQLFRFREQYIWWTVSNIVAVTMYIINFDPVYLTKKSIYFIMGIIGLYNWWKLQKERNAENK